MISNALITRFVKNTEYLPGSVPKVAPAAAKQATTNPAHPKIQHKIFYAIPNLDEKSRCLSPA